ncbi:MAG: TonB-dependent receptor [Chitinophagaceae bacterium]
MHKISSFLVVLLLLAKLSFAQEQKFVFSGNVKASDTQKPLSFATLSFEGTGNTVSTDSLGHFSVPLKQGNYVVQVSFMGYATKVANITLKSDAQTDFELSPSVLEQNAVVVTGVASAISTKRNPQPAVIVTQQDLQATSSTNLMDALSRKVPGFSVLTTGPAIGKPFIRGLGYNRVLTINDGVRQEGQQWGDEHGIEIDDYSAQKVEVLKGPASLMYGSDALAGVINITSQTPAPEGTFKGNISSEYQTNSLLRGFHGDIGGTKNGFSFNAYGSYKGAEDYRNKYDGRVFNSKFYNKNFGGMLGYGGNWGSSRLLVSRFDQHIGMVEGVRDETTGQFVKDLADGEEAIATSSDFSKIKPLVPFQHIRHTKITSDNTFNIGQGQLDAIIGWQRNQRQEFGNAAAPDDPDAYFDLKTWTYNLKYHVQALGNWKTVFGVNGMQQNNTNRADEVLIPDYDLFDVGGFGITQYVKDRFTFSGGLRVDNRHVKGKSMMDPDDTDEEKFAAFSKNFSNVSGSAGMSYEVSNATTLKLNVSRGFRAPNMAELASNGAHEGTLRYEIGNNNLKSEKSLQVDGGVEINTTHVSVNASLFYNHINDFIFYQRVLNSAGGDSTMLDEDGNTINVYKFNQHDANLYGGEFNIDIHPHPLDWLHFENTISYTRAKFSSEIGNSSNIPDIPAARYVAELRGNFLPQGKTFRNFYVSAVSDYTFKQKDAFTGFNTETPTPGYWLVNASVGTVLVNKNGKTICNIAISGDNLGDVAYQSHLSRLKYLDVNNATGRTGVFAMGRNFTFKVNFPLYWNWK